MTGPILELVNPEYDWERVGYGYSASEDIWYPAVIEGATPIYGDNGELFVLYAASGYWTTEYCVGQMKFLGGDLFDANNWEKSPQPVFSKNEEVNGVGGLSPVTTPDGRERYILYHGYLGSTTASGRYCFMEPYTVDENGVHFGSEGHPSPLNTEFVLALNEMHLFKKISGFDQQHTDFLIAQGELVLSTVTPEILELTIYDGQPYDSRFGNLLFSYSTDGISFADGLPVQPGEYTIRMRLSGNYAYEGLGGSFSVTITDSSPHTQEPDLAKGIPVLTVVILSVVALTAVLLIILIYKKKLFGGRMQ